MAESYSIKSGFILMLSFLLLACQSEAKLGARHTATTDAANEKVSSPSGKLTPPDQDDRQYRMGIHIQIEGVDDSEGRKIARGFQDQLSIFEPCLQFTGKTEIVRLRADFELTPRGLVEEVKVTELLPKLPQFSACFLKQIEQLDLGPQKKKWKGRLRLGTYYGSADGWDEEGKKHQ